MKHLKHFALLAFVLIATVVFGQKVKLEEGDLSPAKIRKITCFFFYLRQHVDR